MEEIKFAHELPGLSKRVSNCLLEGNTKYQIDYSKNNPIPIDVFSTFKMEDLLNIVGIGYKSAIEIINATKRANIDALFIHEIGEQQQANNNQDGIYHINVDITATQKQLDKLKSIMDQYRIYYNINEIYFIESDNDNELVEFHPRVRYLRDLDDIPEAVRNIHDMTIIDFCKAYLKNLTSKDEYGFSIDDIRDTVNTLKRYGYRSIVQDMFDDGTGIWEEPSVLIKLWCSKSEWDNIISTFRNNTNGVSINILPISSIPENFEGKMIMATIRNSNGMDRYTLYQKLEEMRIAYLVCNPQHPGYDV